MFFLRPFSEKQSVNIYDWYGVLPKEVISQFEKESGITVHYDVFDNNETLEAKLLASNSGYDVVFPTVVPYAARQIKMEIYQKLDKRLLPNLGETEHFIKEKIKNIDEDMEYILPYYWGTTGIAFDEDKLKEILPGQEFDSYSLIFEEKIVKKLAKYGVSVLQEPIDVFPYVLNYLKKDSTSRELDDLFCATVHFGKLCPYIKRFSSSRFITDLVLGDVCVAQAWSGEALRAIESAKEIGRNIRYIIPKEGTDIWIDAVAIPIGAPNVRNAYKFIDFLLRPDISAKITNHSKMATMVIEAKKYIDKSILENKLIYPEEDVLYGLPVFNSDYGAQAEVYERVRTRIWAQLKMKNEVTKELFDKIVLKYQTSHGVHNEGK